jgi:hypothetical protein
VTVDDVVYDMFGPRFRSDNRWKKNVQIGAAPWGAHEALPVGADPKWDFYHGARFGDEPPWDGYLNIWGQLFTTSSTQELGVRLQVRNPQLWYLAADDVWRKVVEDQSPDTKLTGRFDKPNTFSYVSVSSSEMGLRAEGVGEGWSLRLAPFDRPDVGNFHWWYNEDYGVKPKVPAGTKGLFVAAEMRLIHDGDLSIDLDREVNVVAGMGSDHWPFASGSAGYGQTIELSTFMQPRMKFVTSEWNTFTAHSFTAWFNGTTPNPEMMNGDLIRRYPPPLVGMLRQR